jgi:hypothetical protein
MPAPCFGRMELKDEMVVRGLALRAAVAGAEIRGW